MQFRLLKPRPLRKRKKDPAAAKKVGPLNYSHDPERAALGAAVFAEDPGA